MWPCGGRYWSIKEMLEYMEKAGHDSEALWRRIKQMVVKMVLAVETKFVYRARKYVQYRGNCFELLGLDVLIDQELRPWLIETNPDPGE